MIISLLIISLILLVFVTYWIISKIIKFDKTIKNLSSNTYFLKQKFVLNIDKINNLKKRKTKKKNKINYFEIVLIIIDVTLTMIYKRKYERLKDYYEFIKNTMA